MQNRYPYIATPAKGSTADVPRLYFDASGIVSALYTTDAEVQSFFSGPAFTDGVPAVLAHRKQSGICLTDVNSTLGIPGAAPVGTYTVTSGELDHALNGQMSVAVWIKGAVSDTDLLTLKRWVVSLTPNGPVF